MTLSSSKIMYSKVGPILNVCPLLKRRFNIKLALCLIFGFPREAKLVLFRIVCLQAIERMHSLYGLQADNIQCILTIMNIIVKVHSIEKTIKRFQLISLTPSPCLNNVQSFVLFKLRAQIFYTILSRSVNQSLEKMSKSFNNKFCYCRNRRRALWRKHSILLEK